MRSVSLCLLLLFLVSSAVATDAQAKRPVPAAQKRVLFICTGNFYRSRFAEEIFKSKALPKEWSAFSRGLETSEPRATPVSPLVRAELERLKLPGSPELERYPQPLTQEDLDRADVVVLLDREEHEPMLKRKFPTVAPEKLRYWSVKDTPKMSPEEAFATIVRQVNALALQLKR